MIPLHSDILQAIEAIEVDAEVSLLTVDASAIGGSVYRFTPAPVIDGSGDKVAPVFNGVTYPVIPFTAEGMDFTSGGPLPQPTVRFLTAHVDNDPTTQTAILLALMRGLDDMLGAIIKKLAQCAHPGHLGTDPNPLATLGQDIFTVSQKSAETPNFVEFTLKSAIDVDDLQLPRRQVLDFCPFKYRNWTGSAWDYTGVACPYTGTNFFDAEDNPVVAEADDVPSRSLNCCKLRFGANAVLPFGGFPAAGKFARG